MLGEVLIFPAIVVGLSFWPAVFFWGVVAAIFIELCFDQGMIALATLCLAILSAFWLGFVSLDFVYQHQREFLWLLAFYIPIGIVWATFRWYPLYVFGVRNKVRKYLAKEEAALQRVTRTTPEEVAKGMIRVRDRLESNFEELPPRVFNHKSDLMRWMAWWPFSVVTYALGDMLREVFTWIYETFGDMWQAMSDHAFRNVDFKNPPPPPPEPVAAVDGDPAPRGRFGGTHDTV